MPTAVAVLSRVLGRVLAAQRIGRPRRARDPASTSGNRVSLGSCVGARCRGSSRRRTSPPTFVDCDRGKPRRSLSSSVIDEKRRRRKAAKRTRPPFVLVSASGSSAPYQRTAGSRTSVALFGSPRANASQARLSSSTSLAAMASVSPPAWRLADRLGPADSCGDAAVAALSVVARGRGPLRDGRALGPLLLP